MFPINISLLCCRLTNRIDQIHAAFLINKYKFSHWFFRWNVDEDGDIVFSVANIIHFIKYKEHTVVKVGHKQYDQARKWVEAVRPYVYRGLPCNCSETPYAVCGSDHTAGGILEWCTDEEDANDRLALMKRHNQFSGLYITKEH